MGPAHAPCNPWQTPHGRCAAASCLLVVKCVRRCGRAGSRRGVDDDEPWCLVPSPLIVSVAIAWNSASRHTQVVRLSTESGLPYSKTHRWYWVKSDSGSFCCSDWEKVEFPSSAVRPASLRFTTVTSIRSSNLSRSAALPRRTALNCCMASKCVATRRRSPPYLRSSRALAASYAAAEWPRPSIA